jgi:hypothetical protein
MSEHLAPYFLPRSAELAALGEEIHAERQDLQQAYPDASGIGFAKWLAVNGPLEYPDRVGRFFPPPSPRAR